MSGGNRRKHMDSGVHFFELVAVSLTETLVTGERLLQRERNLQ